MKRKFLCLFLLLVLTCLNACTALQPETNSDSMMFKSAESPYINPETMIRDEIIHLPTGTEISKSELFSLLARRRVIFVGEGHDNIYDHQVELEVIKNLAKLFPERLAVGFEMLSHSNQKKVDLWLDGKIEDDEFIRLFADDWGLANFIYYKDIFNYLKARQIPVRALNVSRPEKMKFMQGLLSSDKDIVAEKKSPETVCSDLYQEAALQAMFKGHSGGHGNLDLFIKVQQLWEDTMTRNITNYLKSVPGREKVLIVIAGGFHIAQGFGLPRRVFKENRLNYCTLLTQTPDGLVENERQMMDVDLPEIPLILADYLWCVPYRNLKDKQVRLGISMHKQDRGIKIEMVEKGSAAEKYGFKIGDIVIACDRKQLKEPFDLQLYLSKKIKGDVVTLQIDRDGKKLLIEITL